MSIRQKTVRWGIIGCGDVTEVKSGPAYQQVDGFELKAVMARTPGKALDYAHRHNIEKFYTDAQQLIDDPEIDAIYIATPPDSHHQYALKVAQAGKICSLEKPMALNFTQCRDIQLAFEKYNATLFVAYYRRCLPAFNRLKSMLTEGIIGEIRHLNWHYSRPPSKADLARQTNWRTQSEIAPGGYFDDIACHGLDIFVYLLGNASHVSGVFSNQQNLYSAYDSIAASILFKSNVTASCQWNFGSANKHDQVQILGSEGQITFGIFDETPAVLENNQGLQKIPMPKPIPIQLDYVKAMRDHLFGISRHPSTADSASHTSWIMDKILGRL